MEGEEGESSAKDLFSLSQKVPLKDLDVEKGSILSLRYLLTYRTRAILTRSLYILNPLFEGQKLGI